MPNPPRSGRAATCVYLDLSWTEFNGVGQNSFFEAWSTSILCTLAPPRLLSSIWDVILSNRMGWVQPLSARPAQRTLNTHLSFRTRLPTHTCMYRIQAMANANRRTIAALATRVRTLEDDADESVRMFALAKTQFEASVAAGVAREEELLTDADRSRAAVRELTLDLASARKMEESTATLERTAREEVTRLKTTLRETQEKLAGSGARVVELEGAVRQLREKVGMFK